MRSTRCPPRSAGNPAFAADAHAKAALRRHDGLHAAKMPALTHRVTSGRFPRQVVRVGQREIVKSLGGKSEGLRLERMKASPLWAGEAFRNVHPVLAGLRNPGAAPPTL